MAERITFNADETDLQANNPESEALFSDDQEL